MESVSLADHWTWTTVGLVILLLTALEALGSHGFDNLCIPLAAAWLLERSLQPMTNTSIIEIWIGIGLAIGFIWFTVRRQSLNWGGAVTAAVLGLWLLFLRGLPFLWPLVFFFVTSTLLGRLTKRRTIVSDAKHGKARDYRQVLCNGGIYTLLATFANGFAIHVIVAMIASLAVSAADTWASEIGMYFRGRTYDLWRWRPTPVGLSGGVSWAGTLGGLAGAAATVIVCLLGLHLNIDLFLVVTLTGIGFAGMLLDSLLGATLQARYQNEVTGDLTDIPTPILKSGYHWMSNDGVNLLSNLLITLVVLFGCIFAMIYYA